MHDRDPVDEHSLARAPGSSSEASDALDHLHAPIDAADERVVGAEPRVGGGDDEELAPGATRWLDRRLSHGHDSLRVGEVGRRLLVDVVARATESVAERISALDHEIGGDTKEVKPVVEGLASEVDERIDRLRRPLRVEGDVEGSAARLHHGAELLARVNILPRSLEADPARRGCGDLLATQGRGTRRRLPPSLA